MRAAILALALILLAACASSRPPVRIGMSKAEARAAWGAPHRVNRTVTAGGVRSQWAYRSSNPRFPRWRFLYFDGGRLVAWQD